MGVWRFSYALIYGIMIKHLKEDKRMNIQQLRYVVAIANSGTFREAAEKM